MPTIKEQIAEVRRKKELAIDRMDFEDAARLRDQEKILLGQLKPEIVMTAIIAAQATCLWIQSNTELPDPDPEVFQGEVSRTAEHAVFVYYAETESYYEAQERARRWLLAVAAQLNAELHLQFH